VKFSFGLPTYNNDDFITTSLQSIRSQNYDASQVEVIVADGGSSDKTVQIAKSFQCRVLHNSRRLADYGQKICALNATGIYYVIWAADNELVDPNWLNKVELILRDHPEISVVWGPMSVGENDPRINRYYELIQSEPITFFLNHNLERYLKRAKVIQVYGEPCYIFEVNPKFPLIWGANGLVYRFEHVRPLLKDERFLGDNDVFQELIERGHNTVAYMPSLSIEHHTLQSFRHWVIKWVRKHRQHTISPLGVERNLNWLYVDNFFRTVTAWVVYSIIPSVSLAHALYNAVRDRNIYWLYHPLANLTQAIVLLSTTLTSQAGVDLVKRFFRNSSTTRIDTRIGSEPSEKWYLQRK
jgi:glycosyltransferase involved in cell wall biosynthesis